jgi:hypothetical protein
VGLGFENSEIEEPSVLAFWKKIQILIQFFFGRMNFWFPFFKNPHGTLEVVVFMK